MPELPNPWLAVPSNPDYVLSSDSDRVSAYNKDAQDDYRLRLELLPEPFFGTIAAPVVLLALNPGFADKDTEVHARRDVQRLIRSNYSQDAMDYPFYYLDPSFRDSGGQSWWERKLKHLPFSHEILARSMLCVQYFPYHSRRFNHTALDVPSQGYGFALVRAAVMRKALVVIMRSRALWFKRVPELEGHSRVVTLKNPRNVVLSRNNCLGFNGCAGFDDIVSAIQPGADSV